VPVYGIITKEAGVVTKRWSLAGWEPEGIVLVVIPAGGIALDVFADGHQFRLAPNDVFVIPALPDRYARRPAHEIDVSGGGRFVRPDDGGYGTDRRFSELFGRRGTACRAPTRNGDDAMQVVGHDDEGVQFNQWEMVRDILPTTPRDFTRLVRVHFAVDDMAEQAGAFVGAHRDEIRPWLSVIMSLQASGAAMVFVRVVRHSSFAESAVLKAPTL
jgi:hypothetical protein